MTDFPDWQQFPNAQSDNLFPGFTQTLTPGAHQGVMLPALSWSSIMLVVHPTAGACQVTLGHYADAAGTMEIDSDTWGVNAATRLVVRSPLRGKYVRIDYNVTSAVNLQTENWANFLSASSDRISFPVSTQNVSDFNATIPANGVKTYNTGEITAGLALFYFKPYDNAGKMTVHLHAVSELGVTGTLIGDFSNPNSTVQQLITVPDYILQVEIDNTDGTTAHTYDFSLTIPPQ